MPIDDARTLLPGAHFQPPVRRGDLHRARNDGASVILIVDGHFCQEDAVPVREVVDVAQDGALVYGASSTGALRAAECWPAGVRGVGMIYRLFRCGVLDSDDEVAVATDPDRGFRALSVPLVNVRYATARARRAGLIDRRLADEIVEQARRLFYPERTWRTILAAAGVASDHRLAEWCSRVDLKGDDTVQLLRRVASLLEADPDVVVRHRRSTPVPLLERTRQSLPQSLASEVSESGRLDLCRWMVGSGRWLLDRRPVTFTPLGTWSTDEIDEGALVDSLWNRLAATGDLEAELMRLRAMDQAGKEATRRGLAARALDRYLAETEIAARLRCCSWAEVAQAASQRGVPPSWIEAAAGRLARAKRLRAALIE